MVLRKTLSATAIAAVFCGATLGLAHAEMHDETTEREEERQRERQAQMQEAEAERLQEETGIAPLEEGQEVVTEREAQPRELLSTIRQENAALLQVARFASEQTDDPRVREYAQGIIDYATQANRRVEALAEQRDIELATPEPEILSQNVRDTVQLAEGEENFDEVFLDTAVFTSESALQQIEALSPMVEDPELQQYLSQMSGDIERLHQTARQLQQALVQEQRRQEMQERRQEMQERRQEMQERRQEMQERQQERELPTEEREQQPETAPY